MLSSTGLSGSCQQVHLQSSKIQGLARRTIFHHAVCKSSSRMCCIAMSELQAADAVASPRNLSRRGALGGFTVSTLSSAFLCLNCEARADEDVLETQSAYSTIEDGTLAYRFEYPTRTSSGAALPVVMSRKPERYSSAAPLTADARQRIVCELVSLKDAVTVSVSVGPPAGTLRTTRQEDWTAKQMAEQVLLDRSTGRITSGQRVSLATVEDSYFMERNGTKYCVYEHVSQGSPTLLSTSGTTYRHARAVTAARPGLDGEIFLYTLNLSCPEERWEDLQEPFKRAVDSFTLVDPTSEYVAPNQESWRFF
jgi:hypothetical protein